MNHTIIRVTWDAPRSTWIVQEGRTVIGRYPHHDPAVAAARRFARKRSPSTIIVHGTDGKVEEECTVNTDRTGEPPVHLAQ